MVKLSAWIVRPPGKRQPSSVVLATVMVAGQLRRTAPVRCHPVHLSSGTAGNGAHPLVGAGVFGAVVGGRLGGVVGPPVPGGVDGGADAGAEAGGVVVGRPEPPFWNTTST
jgi:hypothetical protein